MSFLRRWRSMGAALTLAGAALLWFALTSSSTASAHPLGNFTINRYAGIELSSGSVTIHYVVDMAEIPAFQERRDIDTDGDDELSAAELDTYLEDQASDLAEGLVLEVGGERVRLLPDTHELAFRPGQGGLDTLRLAFDFDTPLRDGAGLAVQPAQFRDENYGSRIGWREIVVRPGEGARLLESTALVASISDELRAYPEEALGSPLAMSDVAFEFQLGVAGGLAAPAGGEEARSAEGNPDAPLARYADLVATEQLTLGVALIALLAAAGFGALHALSPGHGKTIVAAYLVGTKGTWRHALLLALTVTVTHTSSVYALGFITLYLSEYILPEDLYPWLTVASGALILALGGTLFVSRLRSSRILADGWSWVRSRVLLRPAPRLAFAEAAAAPSEARVTPRQETPPTHRHEEAPHTHGLGRAHSHGVASDPGEALSLRGLIGLGVFGGLLPCPSAIVVMLSAIALHRVAFGLLLIVAFSVGLAGVLTAIGFVLVYAGALPRRLPVVRRLAGRPAAHGAGGLALRLFPVGSAAAVVLAGLVVALRGIWQQGLV